jgi:hypothetical protein
MSKAERETVIRWDCEDRTPVMYTADPAQARRWTRLGYAVRVTDTARDATPRGWSARGAVGCVRFRRIVDGTVAKRANGAQNLSVHRQVLAPRRPEAAIAPPVRAGG